MDNYKLTYFNLRGLAEPIRLLFKYVSVPFEDNRLDVNNWTVIKPELKWQQLPYLEYNGKMLTQSEAIVKFLGRKFELVPDDPWDQAKCDEIYGAAYDLRIKFVPLYLAIFEENKELTKTLRDNLLNASVPLFLSNLNDLLEEIHKSKMTETDLIFGTIKPMWIDFCLANFMEMFATGLDKPTLLDSYPLLQKQQKAVYSLPGVSKWIAERPDGFI